MPRNRESGVKAKARAARKHSSAAEDTMWSLLRGRRTGYKFRREHPIGPYRLDFFCAEAMLAVEMDGEQHDERRDSVRDAYFAELGILTYRIPNRRFLGLDSSGYVDDVAEIVRLCKERVSDQ